MGITFDGVKTNKNADFIDVTKPLNEFQKAKLNNSIKKIYHDFVSLVAKSRKLDVNYVDSIARGRVWAGTDAINIGLIDSIGGLTDAINYAAKEAGLAEDFRIREYPREKSLIEKLVEEMTGNAQTRFVKSELGDYYIYYEELNRLKSIKGVQARMPFFLHVN
jgi:protease-4